MPANSLTYFEKVDLRSEPAHLTKNSLKNSFEAAKGIKILVVEDSSSVRIALQEELTKEGYQVSTAENGRNAIEILQSTRPDVILSDVYMPEMDGMELCGALRRNPLYAHIPIVIMSTENDSGNMRKMMDYGAAAFILKPFNIEQLIITLNNILSYEFMLLLKEKERLTGEQKLLLAGITSLVTALEARDQYTRGHSERVSCILAGLVEHSGGSNCDIQRAQMAGRLHDIGKIGIRDNVLLKPGRLTCEEFEHIQEHPSIGASIIKNIPSISDILPVVYSHHERNDGNGYPQGLSGKLIPLWARMTAVADTYDALTSVRPYRKGMPHEKALDVIDTAAGSQFCPDTVRLFLEWFNCQRPESRFHRFNLST
jgi:putative two-component system response regulator